MTKDELINYSLDFFQEFINGFKYIKLDKPEILEHDLNNLKAKAIRSYDFIKHYKDEIS